MNDHRETMPPNGTALNHDVGVAIALRHRKHRNEARRQGEDHSPLRTSPERRTRRRKQPQPPTRLWWQDLVYGVTLYLICIYLPTLYGLLSSLNRNVWWPFVVAFTKRLGGDAAWTDGIVVLILSTSLAILRISLVRWLVDMQSPGNIQAMVRCKSIHLLSSAYPQSLTPTTNRLVMKHTNLSQMAPSLPSLDDLSGHTALLVQQQQPREITPLIPEVSNMKRSDSWLESTWESVRRSSQKALQLDENPRLHAAPRYATAVFRCLYGIFSLSTAWFGFGKSDFWPAAFGGSGFTRNCWNLKGSPGMEEDFDELNALLKFYYLLQASYHVHSGAFHVLTMLILWARKHKATKPYTSYWRSLLQHGIALLLIGGSHLFASTRRLGAIGSFALDASSFLLHALQVCINAPQTIPAPYIKAVHRGLVIPIFMYCRFYVWPFVVWRSAWLESKDWLTQMESTLFPGIYDAMIYLFTGLTVVLLGLNLVLFKRLVNHPHLQRVYSKNSDDGEAENNFEDDE